MKSISICAFAGLTLSSGLMASPPLDPAGLLVKPADIAPEIAIDENGLHARVGKRVISEARLAPVRELRDMEANEESIQSIVQNKEAKTTHDKLKAPIVLKSMEDALKHLTRASMEKIKVDFDKNQVAIFAWQGSGQDRLHGNYHVNKAKAQVAQFHYMPGRTRDLRTHSVIYLMPKDSQIIVDSMEGRVAVCGVGEIRPVPVPDVPDCKIPVAPMPKGEPKVQIQEKIRE